jgi:hypothetical protein
VGVAGCEASGCGTELGQGLSSGALDCAQLQSVSPGGHLWKGNRAPGSGSFGESVAKGSEAEGSRQGFVHGTAQQGGPPAFALNTLAAPLH